MLTSRRSFEWIVALALAMLSSEAVLAQQSPVQVLDRVNAVTPKAVLEMGFEDPVAGPFDNPPAITTLSTNILKGFSTCQLTATNGLVCVDQYLGNPGRWVRKWDPVTADGEIPKLQTDPTKANPPLFSCEDTVLALDTSKGAESCTGITGDEEGGIVIAGKRKGGYNLIKVVPKQVLAALKPTPVDCPSADNTWLPLKDYPDMCRKVLLPRDRPLLVDITYTRVTLADGSVCTGILALEARTALMFIKDPEAEDKDADGNPTCDAQLPPVLIADGKQWGLNTQAKEVLQGATVLNLPPLPEDNNAQGYSFAVVVSSTGRVLARQVNSATPATKVVTLSNANGTNNPSISALRSNRTKPPGLDSDPTRQCRTGIAQKYGIRTSTKTGGLYISDQNFCEVTALEPGGNWPGGTPVLKAKEYPPVGDLPYEDFVLATKLPTVNSNNTISYLEANAYPPLEPTLAPGISVDLSKCAGTTGCTLVSAGDGGPAAVLSNVKLASEATGATVFQVKNGPDCRWIPVVNWPPICSQDGVILKPVTGGGPETWFLKVSALLPKEVTDQFPDGFFDTRPMYLSPQLRGQESQGYYFDFFFFVPQDDVIFRDVFNLELWVDQLKDDGDPQTDDYLGCMAPNIEGWPKPPILVSTLLKWDIAATISEYVQVVGGPEPKTPEYTDMLTNSFCRSTGTTRTRASADPYNLEFTPTFYSSLPNHNYDPTPGDGVAPPPPEDFFVHVTVDLFYELRDAQDITACDSNQDDDYPRIISSDVCTTLTQAWVGALDKLSKCISGSNYPKTSEAVRNCESFNSQLRNYVDILDTLPQCDATQPPGSCYDRWNRVGEQKARAAVIKHVFNDRLVPSVPTTGFRYPAYEGYGVIPLPLVP